MRNCPILTILDQSPDQLIYCIILVKRLRLLKDGYFISNDVIRGHHEVLVLFSNSFLIRNVNLHDAMELRRVKPL